MLPALAGLALYVLSPVDLVEPAVNGRDQLLVRILREEVLADPARLAARLRRHAARQEPLQTP